MPRNVPLLSGMARLGWILAATACSSAQPAPTAPPPPPPEAAAPPPVAPSPVEVSPPDGCAHVARVAVMGPPDAVPSLSPIYSPPAASQAAGACSPAACPGGLHVDLAHAGDWAPGRYRIEVETEWGTTTCDATVGPGARPSLGPVVFTSSPSQVRIRIERDWRLVVERELSPRFTGRRLQGTACPAACRLAEERVAVP